MSTTASQAESYDKMTSAERFALQQQDPKSFEALRNAWLENQNPKPPKAPKPGLWRGKHYGQLNAGERSALMAESASLFERLRNEWIAAGRPEA